MLKKLMKYEFMAMGRILLPIDGCLILFSIISKLLISIPFDNIIFSSFSHIIMASSIFLMFASITATFLVCIIRFYQNYYTDEGYLMLTLPVTKNSLIINKLIISMLFIIISFLSLFLSMFFVIGVTKSIDIIFSFFSIIISEEFLSRLSAKYIILFIEFILCMIICIIYYLLYGYASISLGQVLIPNHKIVGAFCSGIIFYCFTMVINSIAIFAGTTLASIININIQYYSINLFIIFMGGLLLLYIVYCAVFYFISRYILGKKLNI